MRNRRIRFALCALLALALALVLAAGTFAAEDHGTVVDTGDCGDNLKWTLYEDGLLEITGTGAMSSYGRTRYYTTAPWGQYAAQLNRLEIEEGVTSIGGSAFFGCSGFTGRLTIPDSVTSIGDCAFFGCSGFTGSLRIPDGVTTIGDHVFANCSGFMGRLKIPDGVTTIGEGAFSGCSSFTGSLTIPDSVTTIGNQAFSDCRSFTGSLAIPNSVTSIGASAFAYCSGFTGSLTIPDSLTEISEGTFYYCSGFTGSLTIPDSVTEIGEAAFYDCSSFTGSLTIGRSVSTIGAYAFEQCDGIDKFAVEAGSEVFQAIGGMLCSADGTILIRCPEGMKGEITIPSGVTTIGDSAFAFCSGLTGSLTIPYGVTSIGDHAFSSCDGFTGDLMIPDSVTSIGREAFSDCRGFTGSLTIPDSVTTIGDSAFYCCSGLTGSLIIPDSVTTIGASAFRDCGIDTVYFYGDAPAADNSIFGDRDDSFIVCRLADKEGWPEEGGLWCNYRTALFDPAALVIASGWCGVDLTWTLYANGHLEISGTGPMCDYGYVIENDAVAGINLPPWFNRGIKSLQLNEGITTIGSWAFMSFPYFTEVLTGSLTIPDSVTTIGAGAFSGCSGFTGSLTIPDGVTTIGASAFSGCSGFMGSLTIPDGVTSIGASAFSGCSGFTGSLTIPDSVTTIESGAFSSCAGIGAAVFLGNAPTAESGIFENCAEGFTVYCYKEYSDSFVTVGGKWNGWPLIILDDTVSPAGGELTLTVGGTVQIEYDNPDVVGWLCEDPSVATVSQTGLVTGEGVGTTVVRAYDSSSNPIGGIYAVTVEEAPAAGSGLTPVPGSSCKRSEDGRILGGVPEKTTLEDFLANFDDDSIEVYDNEGEKLDDSYGGYIGTGFKVVLPDGAGGAADEVTVVIAGDLNGDGRINTLDRMILARYLAKWEGYADRIADLAAADINGDGKVNTLDRMILARYLAKWDGYGQYFD